MSGFTKTNKGLQFFKIFARPPYRLWLRLLNYLRTGYNRVLQVILISNISKTPVVSCVLHGRPEIHSLVSHRHVYNYILEIKSFLRFYNDVTVIVHDLSLIHISEPTRRTPISYAVFCLKKKKQN